MQVLFIHQSCFLVEVDEKVLIFDYFGGDNVNGYHFTGKIPSYVRETPIYIFSSRAYLDHFDPVVLEWAKDYDNVHYVFSNDIKPKKKEWIKDGIDKETVQKVNFVKPDHRYEIDDIKIETVRSTESGLAFYITTNGVSIFYAGDLSDWHWKGIGELIVGKTSREYKRLIRKFSRKPINLAFIPMDPRLLEYQFDGLDYFIRNTDAEFIFPMHMWQDYSGIKEYKRRISNLGMADRIIEIERENQVFPFGEN